MSLSMYNENRNRMINYLVSGEKRSEKRLLGFELEGFIIETQEDRKRVLTYNTGIKEILERFLDAPGAIDPKPIMTNGHLMGYSAQIPLTDERSKVKQKTVGVALSLEPASQFEISIGTFTCLCEAAQAYTWFSNTLYTILDKMNIDGKLIHLGYNPIADARNMPLIDKERYRLMNAYLTKRGNKAIDMMRGTAATQISFDYVNEKDFAQKYKLITALAPLISLISDNTANYRNSTFGTAEPMTHARIWQDVDPARCGLMPNTFTKNFGYETYVDWLLSVPPILVIDKEGNEIDTGDTPMSEIISNTDEPLTEEQIAHLFSMVFLDVRVKQFIEMRDADSMPFVYAIGIAALVKGIFYNQDALNEVHDLIELDSLTDEKVLNARANIISKGYKAEVYGHTVSELLDKIFEIARKSLGKESYYLDMMLELVQARTTLRESRWQKNLITSVNKVYNELLFDMYGDTTSLNNMNEYLKNSDAIRDGKPIRYMFTPKIYPEQDIEILKNIAETTGKIMRKGTYAYLHDEDFRSNFEVADDLNDLILIDPGYETLIPVSRVDIFYNEESKDFKFCELNTDGSSGMIFVTELNRALRETKSFQRFITDHTLKDFELFNSFIDNFIHVYNEFENKVDNPRIAIVDFEASIVKGDAKRFIKTFNKRGYDCKFVDIDSLTYENGTLKDSEGTSIDAVWRRAVTSEMVTHPSKGTQALIEATRNKDVCTIGSFRTQPAGSKDFLTVLASEAGQKILTPEEYRFIVQHTPTTTYLDMSTDLDAAIAIPEKWIIKPRDSYGGQGVFAGIDFMNRGDTLGWEQTLRDCAASESYILQEYITPYKTHELPYDFAKDECDRPIFEEFTNLVGLYMYSDKFVGIYSRLGQQGIITNGTGQYIAPTFILENDLT